MRDRFKDYFIIFWVVLAISASLYNFRFIQEFYFRLGDRTFWLLDFTHFLFYCILGVLFFFKSINFFFGIFMAFPFAISMEFLQSFIPGRNIDVRDVLMSMLGWLCGFSFPYMIKLYSDFSRRTE